MSNAESRTVGSYIGEAGRTHTVAVTRLAKNRYTIVDRAEDGSARTVETLAEFDAREETAIALARDYLEQVRSYHGGRRSDHPLGDSERRRAEPQQERAPGERARAA